MTNARDRGDTCAFHGVFALFSVAPHRTKKSSAASSTHRAQHRAALCVFVCVSVRCEVRVCLGRCASRVIVSISAHFAVRGVPRSRAAHRAHPNRWYRASGPVPRSMTMPMLRFTCLIILSPPLAASGVQLCAYDCSRIASHNSNGIC